ncbi:hypothetical protein BOG92_021235 [Streptomyces sp. WAC00263]|nr:hypothetical protein BOG92_021235 [Streptomyces sp. WAC00263]
MVGGLAGTGTVSLELRRQGLRCLVRVVQRRRPPPPALRPPAPHPARRHDARQGGRDVLRRVTRPGTLDPATARPLPRPGRAVEMSQLTDEYESWPFTLKCRNPTLPPNVNFDYEEGN